MKGALWTLNSASFGKYAINGTASCIVPLPMVSPHIHSEPSLMTTMFIKLFDSQHNEKVAPFYPVFGQWN
jgi:hypothetical protein